MPKNIIVQFGPIIALFGVSVALQDNTYGTRALSVPWWLKSSERSNRAYRILLTFFALCFVALSAPEEARAQPAEAESFENEQKAPEPDLKNSANDKDFDPLFDEIEKVEEHYPKLGIYRDQLYANTSRKYRHSSSSPLRRDALKLGGSFFTVEMTYNHVFDENEEKSMIDTLKEEGGSLLRLSHHEDDKGNKFSKVLAVVPQELTSFFIAREKVEHGASKYLLRTSAKSGNRDFYGSDQIIWIELKFADDVPLIIDRSLNIKDGTGYAKMYMTAEEYRAFVPNPQDFIHRRLISFFTLKRWRARRKVKNRIKGTLMEGTKLVEMFPTIPKHMLYFEMFMGKIPKFEVVGDYRPLEPKKFLGTVRRIPQMFANTFKSHRFPWGRNLRKNLSIDRSDLKRHVPVLRKGQAPKRRR